MAVSVFELFKIGIGPSSSHTVGPMRAACTFVRRLAEANKLESVVRVQAELFGSLAHTGRGHGTDKAVMLGFQGELPDQIDPDSIPGQLEAIESAGQLKLGGTHEVSFRGKQHLLFNKRKSLPYHPNGMKFSAWNEAGELISERHFYSVGGGFVVNEDEAAQDRIVRDQTEVPYPFETGNQLLKLCADHGESIAGLMMANEQAWRSEAEVKAGLLKIWSAMEGCIERGCNSPGTLPGGLQVVRRAPALFKKLTTRDPDHSDPLRVLDWVNLYALAVNEENAAGGR
ncbi:MAG: L-serine ammonia-lyase, partial [Xanthomonadales bacterium]|nr:L-serine ammonia-lyase [Xanthomonadales bacterium]